jgi:GntR family transcriptional repressor for pyruvate dehydrogenase complex
MLATTARGRNKGAPIPNAGLVDSVFDRLRTRILEGEFSDGVLPPQGELAEEFDVSRSVVREAMQRLQSSRLIELSQGRNARVKLACSESLVENFEVAMHRSQATLLHLAEVRVPLEAEIAALAAERISDEDTLRLHIAVRKLTDAQTPEARIDADIEFHRIIAEAAGNPIFLLLMDALAELLRESRRRTIGLSGVQPAVLGHKAVLQALQKRDPKAARAAMLEHVQAARKDLESLPKRKGRS